MIPPAHFPTLSSRSDQAERKLKVKQKPFRRLPHSTIRALLALRPRLSLRHNEACHPLHFTSSSFPPSHLIPSPPSTLTHSIPPSKLPSPNLQLLHLQYFPLPPKHHTRRALGGNPLPPLTKGNKRSHPNTHNTLQGRHAAAPTAPKRQTACFEQYKNPPTALRCSLHPP
ncbi:hypothetical protein EJ06DRAFT_351124 [Trichodelitschia bisporula]|uniref:Uncharacterized protein n=1 Tax=Trichodelitschia bisporula TaxID=703511 RepID=A0A6G1I0A8_9PEZI|nr:hypothetical protein EJ06DRAFT_351124 [Trichodelitschia bisporula]